jgi:hypothetical protein
MATTTFRRDFLLRKVLNPGTTATDYMGRATTSTVDNMGRNLIAIDWPGAVSVTLGQYLNVVATSIIYQVTVAGTAGAAAPTAPGVGNTVASGTATVRQMTNG